MKIRTYLDSGVLIAATRGKPDLATAALDVRSNPQRTFRSSVFVKLEVLPKPHYFNRQPEVHFYETYFAAVSEYQALFLPELGEETFALATRYGLAALDALHVAIAIRQQADELITTEGSDKPIHRVAHLRVIGLGT